MFTAFAMIDWAAILAGTATIAWVLWYFFGNARGTPVAASASASASGTGGGVPEVAIVVHGGYAPATIHVPVGSPVRLVFDRQETSSCSEEIVMPDFGVRRFLPAFQKTTIDITAPEPGTYEFTCGMSMLRGRVVAE